MRKTQINREYSASYYFLLSKEYCIKGTLFADEGNLKEAMENFNKAVEVDPANPIAYFNRATVKVDMGDIEGARNDFFNFDRIKNKSDQQ
jgi:tetratricopeptide (TPR) repeat protein